MLGKIYNWRQSKRSEVVKDVPTAKVLLRPLSAWFVLLAVVVVAAVAWPLTQWLYTIAGDDPARKIDAVRTGLSVAAGTGGVFALLLAFRRQRATELIAEQTRLAADRDHEQRDRVAIQTEQDALARRITDQYAKAAEQLGSDKAPVRLAGLYALERVAESSEHERQPVISLLCAYLRNPFQPPSLWTDTEFDSPADEHVAEEELQVRLTAQNMISEKASLWRGLQINLSRATLVNFTLTSCRLRTLRLASTILYGRSILSNVEIADEMVILEVTARGFLKLEHCQSKKSSLVASNEFEDGLEITESALAGLSFQNNGVTGNLLYRFIYSLAEDDWARSVLGMGGSSAQTVELSHCAVASEEQDWMSVLSNEEPLFIMETFEHWKIEFFKRHGPLR